MPGLSGLASQDTVQDVLTAAQAALNDQAHQGGSTIVYRCATAGTARAGTLTTVSADCGTAVDTGVRVP